MRLRPSGTVLLIILFLFPVQHLRSKVSQDCIDKPAGRLAFQSVRDDNTDIYLSDADGLHFRRITHSLIPEGEPTWSPFGDWLAFQSQDQYWQIHVVRPDGSQERRVSSALGWSPSWSPDGASIAFGSTTGIHLIGPEGGDPLTIFHSGNGGRPSWSPDGSQIVFHSRISQNVDLFVLELGVAEPRRLTEHPGRDFQAAWAPSGDQIAFSSDRDGDLEIFLTGPDGRDLTQLTRNAAQDLMPAWSADGEWLAFVSDRDGNLEIYVMKADGSCKTRVTDNPGEDLFPAWRPTDQRDSVGVDPSGGHLISAKQGVRDGRYDLPLPRNHPVYHDD